MNNKVDYFNILKDCPLSLLGMLAGLILLDDSISSKTAIKYAIFAVIVGPVTRIVINQYPIPQDLSHIIVIASGLFGFFIFKGIMVVVLRFSKHPLKTIKEIKTQVKK